MAIIRRAGKTDIQKLISLIKNRFGNVENKSGETIRSEMTKEEVVNALGYDPVPINRENKLKNVSQYTKSNPLVFSTLEAKRFQTTASLEAGKWYSLSFDFEGSVDSYYESGILEQVANQVIDLFMNDNIYTENFYFKADYTSDYEFYFEKMSDQEDGIKLWNIKIVEGYSPEMVNTIMEIKSQITKNISMEIDKERDMLVITYGE